MKQKPTTITFFLLFFCTTYVSAQWGMGKPKDIEEVKNREIMVILQEENPKVIKKLEKKDLQDKIPEYRAAVDSFNAYMKFALETYFPDEEISYQTYEKARELDKDKNESYAVIWFISADLKSSSTSSSGFSVDVDPNLDWSYRDVKKGNIDEKEKGDIGLSSYLRISLIEELTKTPVAQVGLPHNFPNKADLTFAMQYMDWYMNRRAEGGNSGDLRDEIKANASKLPKLTLAMRESDFSEKFEKNKLKYSYKYPTAVMTDEEFDALIMAKTEGYAYIVIIPYLSGSDIAYYPTVVNASTGEPLSIVEVSAGDAIGSSLLKGVASQVGVGVATSRGKSEIDEKVFEAIMKDIEKAKK